MSILCPACKESFQASFLGLKVVCPHCKTDLSARVSEPAVLSNGLSAVLIVVLISLYLPFVLYNEAIGQGLKAVIGIAMLVFLYLISRFITFRLTVRKIKRLKNQRPD